MTLSLRHQPRSRLVVLAGVAVALAGLLGWFATAAIAHRLRLTEKTVKNHLNHVFAKLHVRSRTEAVVRWASGA